MRSRVGERGMTLPMTKADVTTGTPQKVPGRPIPVASSGNWNKRRRPRTTAGSKKAKDSAMLSLGKLLLVILLIGFGVVFLQKYEGLRSGISTAVNLPLALSFLTKQQQWAVLLAEEGLRQQQQEEVENHRPTFPLYEYPVLNEALLNSEVVALYFAASWCPMSTPVTKLLDETFSELLNADEDVEAGEPRKPFTIIYVSSDASMEEMNQYAPEAWVSVPFESPERNALKKHFKVCAKREMDELNLERKYEIPTLVVMSGETKSVITFDGIDDVKDDGGEALSNWIQLSHTIQALEEKF